MMGRKKFPIETINPGVYFVFLLKPKTLVCILSAVNIYRLYIIIPIHTLNKVNALNILLDYFLTYKITSKPTDLIIQHGNVYPNRYRNTGAKRAPDILPL